MRFTNVGKQPGIIFLCVGLALLSQMPALAQTIIPVNDTAQVNTVTCTLSSAIPLANMPGVMGPCSPIGSGGPFTIQLLRAS